VILSVIYVPETFRLYLKYTFMKHTALLLLSEFQINLKLNVGITVTDNRVLNSAVNLAAFS
jgi:hypothetical protein